MNVIEGVSINLEDIEDEKISKTSEFIDKEIDFEEFSKSTQNSIESRIICGIKSNTDNELIIKSIKLLKNPPGISMFKYSIKRNNNTLLLFLVDFSSKFPLQKVLENNELQNAIFETAFFFQNNYD